MNFTTSVKNEIINKGISGNNNINAFLAGFIRLAGSIIKKSGSYGFEFSTESESLGNFIVELFYNAFEIKLEPSVKEIDKLNKKTRLTFECVGKNSIEILSKLEILDYVKNTFKINSEFSGKLLDNTESKKSFIKGVFVGAGNITVPAKTTDKSTSKTGYHLEFVFFSYEAAVDFCALLKEFQIDLKLMERKENFVAYIKSSEEIKDFLALINAPKSVLMITDIIVEKEVFNKVNRQKNCDLANVNKQMIASERQINAIKALEKSGKLKSLSNELYITAIARSERAEDTLSELSEYLNITKSCLNNRLRKLVNLSEELKGKTNE